jgi:Glycine transporter
LASALAPQPVTIPSNGLLFAADIAGTLVFAMEGGMAAVDGNLDLIGIMTLAFCAALGGGIVRDTLLGVLPPASLRDWRYPAIAFVAAALVFFLHPTVHQIKTCQAPKQKLTLASEFTDRYITSPLKTAASRITLPDGTGRRPREGQSC